MNDATCVFCRIANGEVPAVIIYEDDALVAFLDIAPIRAGHTQIIPRRHIPLFDELPPELAARIVALGQRLARRMKEVYAVERAAFLFTGGDVAHAHAHVVPMHAKTDITSARYLVSPTDPEWSEAPLHVSRAELLLVRDVLAIQGPTGPGTGKHS